MKPKSRIPNSITEEEYQNQRKEFCEATEWCSYQDEDEILVLEEDENGVPIITEDKPLFYREVREIIENGFYKCPICNESFDNFPDFIKHWEDKHKEKYGAYRRYRKYKYRDKDTELSEDESKEMLSLWLKSKKKS